MCVQVRHCWLCGFPTQQVASITWCLNRFCPGRAVLPSESREVDGWQQHLLLQFVQLVW